MPSGSGKKTVPCGREHTAERRGAASRQAGEVNAMTGDRPTGGCIQLSGTSLSAEVTRCIAVCLASEVIVGGH